MRLAKNDQIGWFTYTPKPGEDYTGTHSVDEKLWAKSKTSAEGGILEMLIAKNKWVECWWWLSGRKVVRVETEASQYDK